MPTGPIPIPATEPSSPPPARRCPTRETSCGPRFSDRFVAERYARRMGLFLGNMSLQEETYWTQVHQRLALPRGGLNGGGSHLCVFEYEAPAQAVLDTILHGLKCHPRSTYDGRLDQWQRSTTIDTYAAMTHRELDHYLKLHSRKSLAKYRHQLYRSTRLLSPSTMQGQSIVVSACQPWLVEVCHRGNRVVLVTSFRLFVLSDLNSLLMPPTFQYAIGMDLQFRARALQHLKEMVQKCGAQPTAAFMVLLGLHFYLASSSEESQEETEEADIGWPESSDAPSDSASDAAVSEDLMSEEEQPSRPSQRRTPPRAAHSLN